MAEQNDDIEITLRMPLSAVNVVLVTLDTAPPRGSVTQTANLIQGLRAQAQAQIAAAEAAKSAEATQDAAAEAGHQKQPVAKAARKPRV